MKHFKYILLNLVLFSLSCKNNTSKEKESTPVAEPYRLQQTL